MIDWKKINRKIKEILSNDGFDNLGAISISYDDNWASVMSSLIGDAITIRLEDDDGYGKIYLELDESATIKNKNRFQKINEDKDLIDLLKENYGMIFDKVSDDKVLIYESKNSINETYYIEKVTNIFEKIWPTITETKLEEAIIQPNILIQKTEVREEKQSNQIEENRKTTDTNTIIRLVSKENSDVGITYRFILNNDNYHDLAVMVIEDNGPIESVSINVQSHFEYYVSTKENNAKLIIQENGKKLYQCRIAGANSDAKTKIVEITHLSKENKIEEKNVSEVIDEQKEELTKTITEPEESVKTLQKIIIDKEFSFDHKEIFDVAMGILS